MRFAPCLLDRKILPKPWGGRALERAVGIPLPPGEAIGETWEVYDRPDGSSRIRGTDRTLADLMREDPAALLGAGVAPAFGGRFPLLVKFIDAADRLSVQVHPGEAQARADGDGPKTEAWVVLGVGPAGRIVCGVRPGVSADAFRAAAATPAVEGLLDAFRPELGDIIYVPHGTVHAMGPDVVVLEVQQNSDVTYRLYDWGRPRETHLAAALQATRIDARRTVVRDVLRCPAFGLELVTRSKPETRHTGGKFALATVVGGQGRLAWAGGALAIGPADTVLVPACVPAVTIEPAGRLDLVWSTPGDPAAAAS